MRILYSLFFTIIISTGCKPGTAKDKMNTAAIHFSGVFITENIHSVSTLRIEGRPDVKNEPDSAYFISGSIEGFSPANYPVTFKHFSEILHYLGGDPNDIKSWVCIAIYVGNKKIK